MRKETKARARVFDGDGGRPRQNSLVLDELMPAVGFDAEGQPPIQHLASLEEQARHRLNPRRPMWPELQKFEGRLAELEGRHRNTIAALGVAKGKLHDADRVDAAALSRWEVDGRQGVKPAPGKPALVEHVASLERDRDGLAGAIAQVLAEKAEFVVRHRDRLAAVAERMVEQARVHYLDLVAQIDSARSELISLRESALWAAVFPHDAASLMPKTDHLALGRPNLYPSGLADRALDASGVFALLRADVDAVAAAMSSQQRVVIERLDPRKPPGTGWAADSLGDERKREIAALVEEARREFGRDPSESELEAFARERARGNV